MPNARDPRLDVMSRVRSRNDPTVLNVPQIAELRSGLYNAHTANVKAQSLGEISSDLGDVGRGQLSVRADGVASIARLNKILFFSTDATPIINLPGGCLSGSNIVEVVLTGQFFQGTGSSQTLTPKFYIGKQGSEVIVTSETPLTVASGSTRKGFTYTVRVSSAPQGGNYVQCDEVFQLENSTAGAIATIMRTTRSTNIIDIENIGEVNSCYMRIANGAAATLFRIFTNTVSVRILDAEPTNEINWYTQLPSGSDTHIDSVNPTTNFNSSVRLGIGEDNTAANIYRTLLNVGDLSNFLSDPNLDGFVISSAYLYLTIELDRSTNARNFNLYRMLVDWDITVATWNLRKTATNWAVAGVQSGTEYDATPLAACSFTSTETLGSAKSFVFTAYGISELQKIINGTYVNNGFFIKADTETNDAYTFHSSEAVTPDFAPILHIIGYRPN